MTISKHGWPEKEAERLLSIRLDRTQFDFRMTRRFHWPQVPGFSVFSDFRVPSQTSLRTYARVRRYQNPHSGTDLFIQYSRQCPWLAELKMTIVGDDWKGLCRKELESILCNFPPHRLLTAELAFDFSELSRVDCSFVRRHALFGRSCPDTRSEFKETLRYGSRKGSKLIRCYPTAEATIVGPVNVSSRDLVEIRKEVANLNKELTILAKSRHAENEGKSRNVGEHNR